MEGLVNAFPGTCARITYGNDEVVPLGLLAHGEVETVEKLVLENTDGVGVTDGGLEQTLGILGGVRRNDLKTGDGAVPRSVVLGVLGGDTGGETVGATEGDVAGLDTTGHVVGLSGGVDDLVNGLHGEVEGHELADGVQTSKGSTDGQTAETRLGDGRVNDTLVTEAVEQAFGDLVAGETLLSAFCSPSICTDFNILRVAAARAQKLWTRHCTNPALVSILPPSKAATTTQKTGRLTRRCTGQPPHRGRKPSRSSPSPRPWPRSGHHGRPSP